MKQRVPRRAWNSRGGAGRRPRLLIEDDHPALAISDFSMYQEAGFDIAYCSGPGADAGDCPLLQGKDCAALAGADAVLHGLDPGLGIAEEIRRQHPGITVVVEQYRHANGSLDTLPAGCVPVVYPCSVKGQVDAVRRAVADSKNKAPGGGVSEPAATRSGWVPPEPGR
jgi:hypothetical protein